MGVGILGAEVDVALGRPNCDRRDGHALDQHQRVAFHDHPVGKGAGVALVGVADDVLLRGGRSQDGLPLDPGGKGGTTAAAQAGEGDGFHDCGAAHRQRLTQSPIALVGDVVLDRHRIGDADAGEGQPLLALEIGDLRGESEGQSMRLALEEPGIEQSGHIGRSHRAVGHPSRSGLDLDHRLEPVQATRPVPNQGDGEAADGGLGGDRPGDRFRSDGQGAGVAGDEDADGHAFPRISRTSASNDAGVTRP